MGVLEGLNGSFGGTASIPAMSGVTDMSFKLRFRGDCATGIGGSYNFCHMFLPVDSMPTPTIFGINPVFGDPDGTGTNVRFEMRDQSRFDASTLTVAVASVDPAAYYVWYGQISTASPYLYSQITNDAGTASFGNFPTFGYNPGSTISGFTVILAGVDVGEGSGMTGPLDGLAIYSGALAGAARYSVPLASDSNLLALYYFDDTSGTTATAAVGGNMALSGGLGTAYQWTTGAGLWSAPASYTPPALPYVYTVFKSAV